MVGSLNKLYLPLSLKVIPVILVTIALIRISGLDLALAQIEAWTSMVYNRMDQGLITAVESTLSGRAPCQKCLALKSKSEERQTNPFDVLISLDKLKLPVPNETTVGHLNVKRAKEPENFTPPRVQFVLLNKQVETPPPQG